jgi:hypothetical protein
MGQARGTMTMMAPTQKIEDRYTPVKTIHLSNELDRLQDRISVTRAFHHDVDCPEKQRVVSARRVKLSGW